MVRLKETTQSVVRPKETTQSVVRLKETMQSAVSPKETTESVVRPKETTQSVVSPKETTQSQGDYPVRGKTQGDYPVPRRLPNPKETTQSVVRPNETLGSPRNSTTAIPFNPRRRRSRFWNIRRLLIDPPLTSSLAWRKWLHILLIWSIDYLNILLSCILIINYNIWTTCMVNSTLCCVKLPSLIV